MAESYLVLWTQDRVRDLKRAGDGGKPLQVLFGGVHLSCPGYTNHGVVQQDLVYVVSVRAGRLYLLGRMKVRDILPVDEYREKHRPLLGPDAPLHARQCDGCLSEALLGVEGTPLRFTRGVPVEVLERLRFRNKRGEERGVQLENGRFNSGTIQGHVMRLAPGSARDFEALLDGS